VFAGRKFKDGSGITTTIRGKGESMDDLSSSDGTELGVIARQDSEEGLRPMTGGQSRDSERGFGSREIHVGTTVEVSEEHVLGRDKQARPGQRMDLESGEVYDWSYEKIRR